MTLLHFYNFWFVFLSVFDILCYNILFIMRKQKFYTHKHSIYELEAEQHLILSSESFYEFSKF